MATSLAGRCIGPTVDLRLTLEPMESVLLVFQPEPIERPVRIESDTPMAREPISVTRVPSGAEARVPAAPPADPSGELPFDGCAWIWYGDEDGMAAPRGSRYFRYRLDISPEAGIVDAKIRMTADNAFILYVNGREAGRGQHWQVTPTIDLTDFLRAGPNVLAVEVSNGGSAPNPAGLIGCYEIALSTGVVSAGRIDDTWKSHKQKPAGWNDIDFDDTEWITARVTAASGDPPWGHLDGAQSLTLSPVRDDPFLGRFDIPGDCDPSRYRSYLEMRGMATPAVAVTINGQSAGGVIGRPLRLDVSQWLRAGDNTVRIAPYAPTSARIVFYEANR